MRSAWRVYACAWREHMRKAFMQWDEGGHVGMRRDTDVSCDHPCVGHCVVRPEAFLLSSEVSEGVRPRVKTQK